MEKKVKVLYIAGVGRSGSTLLGRILGEMESAVFVGEVKNTPASSDYRNRECGCGEGLLSCPIWGEVLPAIENGKFGEWRKKRVRDMLFGKLHFAKSDVEEVEQIYSLLARKSGKQIIVDSSKFPSYLYLLSKSENIDLSVIHITRDPRAVVHSWWNRPLHEQKKNTPIWERSKETLRYENPVRSVLIWSLWNYIISANWSNKNYTRVKYEDLCSNPKSEIDKILNNFEIDDSVHWVDPSTIELGTHHSIQGNPNQSQKGKIKIEKREKWKEDLSPVIKVLVYSLAFPLMHKFSYT